MERLNRKAVSAEGGERGMGERRWKGVGGGGCLPTTACREHTLLWINGCHSMMCVIVFFHLQGGPGGPHKPRGAP